MRFHVVWSTVTKVLEESVAVSDFTPRFITVFYSEGGSNRILVNSGKFLTAFSLALLRRRQTSVASTRILTSETRRSSPEQ
jgi:hypothetical protein